MPKLLHSPARLALIPAVTVAAVGIALARGRKEDAAPEVPPPVAAVEAEPAPPPPPEAPPAPPLFPAPASGSALPVVVDTLPAGLASLSAQGCNACHAAAHDTWSGSRHAHAWTDPVFQAAIASAGDSTLCQSCHLPIAAQHASIADGYVDGAISRPRLVANTAFDAGLRAEGVTCAACHVRTMPDGSATVLGTHPATNSPHRVTVTDELQKPELCATCHEVTFPGADQPYYATYTEWKNSGWSRVGVSCQACHMAPTTGAAVPGSNGAGPAHTFSADPARALSALVRMPGTVHRNEGFDLTLTLQNTGAGHSVPTGNPANAAVVTVALLDSAGKELAPAWVQSFARSVEPLAPYRTTSDTRIPAGGQAAGTHRFTPSVKGAPGLGYAEVRLTLGNGKSARNAVLARVPVQVE